MKGIHKVIILLSAVLNIPVFLTAQQGYSVKQVPFTAVKITDKFWSSWLTNHADNTLPACIAQIRDSTGRIGNFEKAAIYGAGGQKGKFVGTFFDDSDVYKVMEGMAYSLQNKPNPEIEALLDKWIDLMAQAQQPNGYLNTFFILDHDKDYWPEYGRWSDIGRHEMYCGGHMIEAAVAYYKATGKRKFLDVAIKFADHWIDIFGPNKRHWVEGHQEPELALVKLYQITNEKKYLDFAHWLLEERGHGYEFGPMWLSNPKANIDILTDTPVADITDVKGHAVRAMYMYSGMTDVMVNTGDSSYMPALKRVWDDVVLRNMYITGGIGSSNTNEGFLNDYELPNKTSYCETCSSVGMVLWNSRMSLLTTDRKYADVMERAMYNAVLGGVSLKGDRFFYVNPMESDGNNIRSRWHGTACCPSNIARFLPQVGNYVYMQKDNDLYVNLYVGSETKITLGTTEVAVVQKTDYPWAGGVQITVNPSAPIDGAIKLRIPEWCKTYTAKINGKLITQKDLQLGYLPIQKTWKKGDVITLDLAMPIEMVAADPRVKDDAGRRAIQRGPIVYCAEQVDNPGIDLNNVTLTNKNTFKIVEGEGILKGIKKLTTTVGKDKITLVPYYAWENREPGKMIVWMKDSD